MTDSSPHAKRHQLEEGPGLDPDQQRVFDQVGKGSSLFFTGPAGTGKSFLLGHVIDELTQKQQKTVFVTSSTGVSALNIGGTTLHSFAGIGLGDGTPDQLVKKIGLRNPRAKQRWQDAQVLVIDEISMIDAELFDKLSEIARAIRKKPLLPFGGIQVIACGDFYQLPPVKGEYCFTSKAWKQLFTPESVIQLTRIHRQKDGTEFVDGLNSMRHGALLPEFLGLLSKDREAFYLKGNGVLPSRLLSKNKEVDDINQRELDALVTEKKTFKAKDIILVKDIENIDELFTVPSSLVLAVGAQVMTLKNCDGYANGTRGVVEEIKEVEGEVVVYVRGLDKAAYTVMTKDFEARRNGRMVAIRKCLPLKLAWAISIHKSQGLSIDYLDVDLSSVFSPAQAYVAVSRARTIEGIRVSGLHDRLVYCDPRVTAYHQEILNADK